MDSESFKAFNTDIERTLIIYFSIRSFLFTLKKKGPLKSNKSVWRFFSMTNSTEIKCLIVGCGKVLKTTKSSPTPAINRLLSKKHNYTKNFIEGIDIMQANLQNIMQPKQIDQVDLCLERKILRLVCLTNLSMDKGLN